MGRTWVFAGSAILAMAGASAATAADLRGPEPAPYVMVAPPTVMPAQLAAVSALNGKIELAGGYEWGNRFADHALARLAGSVSFPIGHQFGGQVDVTGLYSRGDFAGALAGHAFWRNPATALIGVYAEGSTGKVPTGNLTYGRFGLEGELYMDRLRLSGLVGVETGQRIDNRLFVDTLASFYAMDDLRLYAGYRNNFAGHQGRAGVEYQFAPHTGWGNTAIFAEARLGEHGYAAGLAGVKVYFGETKSLWRRHREDDPEIWSNQNFADVSQAVSGGSFKKKNKKCVQPVQVGENDVKAKKICVLPEEPN